MSLGKRARALKVSFPLRHYYRRDTAGRAEFTVRARSKNTHTDTPQTDEHTRLQEGVWQDNGVCECGGAAAESAVLRAARWQEENHPAEEKVLGDVQEKLREWGGRCVCHCWRRHRDGGERRNDAR